MAEKKTYTAVHPACRSFVAAVEELLERRQHDAAERTLALAHLDSAARWGPRVWKRTELEDMVYSSYKQMRQGRITRPPRREVVMEIADYLDCSLAERNRLLIAAGTTPVSVYLTGAELEPALRVAVAVAQGLSLPAVVINRDWHVHYLNPPMLQLYGITPAELALFAPEQFNILRLLFDPDLPLYPNLIQNRGSWTQMVRQTIYGFKKANWLCQFEPWYRELVAQLMQLPEFEAHWRGVTLDMQFERDVKAVPKPPEILLETLVPQAQPTPQRAVVRPLLISVGYFHFDFPQIVGFLPADEPSRAIFVAAGLPTQPE